MSALDVYATDFGYFGSDIAERVSDQTVICMCWPVAVVVTVVGVEVFSVVETVTRWVVDFVADVVTWLPAVGFAVDVTAVNACCCVVVDESVCSPGGLAENSQSHEISARDNLVLACNFAKYSPITNVFTDRLSNKPFLIWLQQTNHALNM